jgi:uncharacterized protein
MKRIWKEGDLAMNKLQATRRADTITRLAPPRAGVWSAPPSSRGTAVPIPQYSIWQILGVWALAAFPMGALAWLVAPVAADQFSGEGNVPMVKALFISLTVGLIWQFVLIVALVGHEQRRLRWSTLRDALWLHSPRSPRSGRVGGRIWLVLVPLIVAFAAAGLLIPELPYPVNRDLGAFLGSDTGQSFLSGNWVWFGLIVAAYVFNTVLGEELLFRGLLGCERRAVRRLPPPRAVAHPGCPARHIHRLLSDEALPQRLDRDRRAQLPKPVLRRTRAHPRSVRREEPWTLRRPGSSRQPEQSQSCSLHSRRSDSGISALLQPATARSQSRRGRRPAT